MHDATYHYREPTDDQINRMERCRDAAKAYSDVLERELPEGPDKTYLIRKLREVAMWANVCVTRQPDGTPRDALKTPTLSPSSPMAARPWNPMSSFPRDREIEIMCDDGPGTGRLLPGIAGSQPRGPLGVQDNWPNSPGGIDGSPGLYFFDATPADIKKAPSAEAPGATVAHQKPLNSGRPAQ